MSVVVVGAGLAGTAVARTLAEAGVDVRVVERRDHVAGNCHDYVAEFGIRVHSYGPHIFHTNSSKIVDFLGRFTGWRPYEHRAAAIVRGELVPFPPNLDSLERVPGDAFENFYLGYSLKQWGRDPRELDPNPCARVRPRASHEDRYFTDRYQMMPADGYTRMVERMLDHERIEVQLCRRWLGPPDGGDLFWSGPPDELFGFDRGRLPYRSLTFRTALSHSGLGYAQINFPSARTPMTRMVDYGRIDGRASGPTVIGREYPTAEGDPFYPMPVPEGHVLRHHYLRRAERAGVTMIGRLGTWRYLNMDQAVGGALACARRWLSHAGAKV